MNIDLDPITKEIIEDQDKIIIKKFIFNFRSLIDWFLVSNDWINPLTNLRFLEEDVNLILLKAFENKYYSDFINLSNMKIYGILSIKLFKKITTLQKKYNLFIENSDNKINVIREKYNKISNKERQTQKMVFLLDRIEKLEGGKNKKYDDFFSKFKKVTTL